MPAIKQSTTALENSARPRRHGRYLFVPFLVALLLSAVANFDVAAQDKPAGAPAQATSDQSPVSPAHRAATEKIIREYLLSNPEIVVEAIRIYRQQAEKASEARAQAVLSESRAQLVNDPDSPVGGNPNGDVTIVEFFDYRCGFCKRVYPVLQEIIKTDKNVKIVFKEFPILGDESMFASRAALAAFQINPKKYEAFHNALMQSNGGLPQSKVFRIAGDHGYDPDALRKVMNSPEIEARIQKNYLLAESLNIRGTPAFVVGNELVPGAVDVEQLRRLIAQARSG